MVSYVRDARAKPNAIILLLVYAHAVCECNEWRSMGFQKSGKNKTVQFHIGAEWRMHAAGMCLHFGNDCKRIVATTDAVRSMRLTVSSIGFFGISRHHGSVLLFSCMQFYFYI